jgi:hypothetical protein
MKGTKNKYSAVAKDGFPSKLEAAVYDILLLREKAKEIKDIRRQVRVELTKAAIAAKIDFAFIDVRSGETVYCEAKGSDTERWILIKRLWPHYGPANLEIFKGRYTRPQLVEIIEVER